jgi:gliding motility-associated-like protein
MPIVIGGNGGYTLTWSSGETGFNPAALCSTFELTIEDSEGCTADTTVTFTNLPDPIVVDATVTGLTCFGFDDGSIDLEASGGTGSLSFDWSGPNGFTSVAEDLANLEPGDYTVTVTDGNSCAESETYTITENPELLLSASATDNLCNGDLTGSIDLTITGGLPPFAISWTGPSGFLSTEEDPGGLEAGLYEVTITDAANCIRTTQVTVNEPTQLGADIGSQDLFCFEDNSGEITAAGTGGTPLYTYGWTGPNGFTGSGPGISGLEAGTYSLTVNDANGCAFLTDVTVSEPIVLSATITETSIACQGDANGALDLDISGGTAPYSVSWSGPNGFSSSDEDITGLEAGAYTADILDDNNCLLQLTYDLVEPLAINLTATTVDPDCASGDTGEIDLTVANGTPPYSYSWDGPAGFTSTDEDLNGLDAGDYSVEVTDANGCLAVAVFTLTDPANIDVSFVVSSVSCHGGADGSIATTVSGGTPPYTYLWLGPSGFNSFSPNISDLEAGNYSLLVNDANGCSSFFNANVTEPANLSVSSSITDVSCFGSSDGSISITLSGATPPFSFLWSGPGAFSSSTEDISGLSAGDYTVEITDGNGCPFTRLYTVDEPNDISIDATLQDVICTGQATGSIDITVAGGSPGFLFDWTGPAGFSTTSEDLSNLEAGTYVIEITDAQGCTATESFEIQELFEVLLTLTPTDISCFGQNDGTIELTANGGLEPYTFSWTGPDGFTSADEDPSGLEPGLYEVEVSDANGCLATGQATVNEPTEISISTGSTDISCFGANDGTAEVLASGGVPPLTISWSGPNGFSSNSPTPVDLETGEYSVEVTDGSGCSVTDTVFITEPDELMLNLSATNPDCLVDNGSVSVSPSGGTVAGDYLYEWIDEGGNVIGSAPSLSDLGEGAFTITVTDDNGCTVQETIDLIRITFDVSVAIIPVSCPGGNDGSIDSEVSQGTPPFTISWTGPAGFTADTEDIFNLPAGDYELTIVDATGCNFNMTYSIDQPDEILFNALVTPESCQGAGDGSVDVNLTGGTAPYTYAWTSASGFSADQPDIFGLSPETYLLTVIDGNGCQADTSVILESAPGVLLSFDITDVDCFGEATGAIETNLSGGTSPYFVSWTGPDGFSSSDEDLTDLFAGSYEISVQDVNGCAALDTVLVLESGEILISVVTEAANCAQSDGLAIATATGGSGEITYVWQDLDANELTTNDSLIDVSAGIYVVTATDELGCFVSETVTISDSDGSITGVLTPPTCAGANDGIIDATVTGGTSPFVYEWADATGIVSDQEDLSGVSAGTYTLTVTDANGCLYAEVFELIDPPAIIVDPFVTDVSCLGDDGSISLTVENATEPVTVDWTGPAGYTGSGLSISGLGTGTYSFTLSDAQGCTSQGDVEVIDAPIVEVDETVVDLSCHGDNSGSIELAVISGVPPYTFAWEGPDGFVSDQEDLFNLSGGTYEVQITDGQGCDQDFTYEVIEPDTLSVDYTFTEPDCNQSNGSIVAEITGGTVATEYGISWIDESGTEISTDQSLSDVPAGIYTLTVTDDNGCLFEESISLSNPGGDISSVITPETCAGEMNGAIDMEISGVAEPYSIEWTGPNGFSSTFEDLSGLSGGSYTYLISAADGCIYSETLEVPSPEALYVMAITENTCFAEQAGGIDLTISGGVGPYLISWTGPDGFNSSEEDLVDLGPGVYNLSIVDDAGCPFVASYEILESPEITASFTPTDLTCFGENDGSIDLSLSGGTPPLAVNWGGPEGFTSDTTDLDDLQAGDYFLIVSDAFGCLLADTVVIAEPEELTANEIVTSSGCEGATNSGAASVFPQGGSPGYAINWTGPNGFSSNVFDLENLEPGIYDYILEDQSGCSIADSVEINVVEPLEVVLETIAPTCSGSATGSLEALVTGGAGEYGFAWTGPGGYVASENPITGLITGLYQVEVTDESGCITIEETDLQEPDALEIEFTSTASTCANTSDGTLEATVTGGTAPFTYNWFGPGDFSSDQESLSDLAPGLYVLDVLDQNGCQTSDSTTIDILFELEVSVGDDFAICPSELPTNLVGDLTGGDFYYWVLEGDTVSQSNEFVLSAGSEDILTLILIGSNGTCSETDTVNVEVFDSPNVDAGEDLRVFTEEVFTLGGNPTSTEEVTYFWQPNPGGIFETNVANPVGFLTASQEFTVSVTDQNGCMATDSIFVEVLPELVITSGFTPNGDGTNDLWIIDNIELFPEMVVHVYNRWGVEVFESQGYNANIAWDGTYNGTILPSGTYYYAIELNDARFPEPLTGPLTLHR